MLVDSPKKGELKLPFGVERLVRLSRFSKLSESVSDEKKPVSNVMSLAVIARGVD